MSHKTSIVLADDHHVVRQGSRALLEAAPGLVVLGEAAEGAAAVEMTARLAPDVLILDLVMPGNGLDVLRQVTHAQPDRRRPLRHPPRHPGRRLTEARREIKAARSCCGSRSARDR
jgi:CheY-like chemotaxis protein